jgi:hypothetical protein
MRLIRQPLLRKCPPQRFPGVHESDHRLVCIGLGALAAPKWEASPALGAAKAIATLEVPSASCGNNHSQASAMWSCVRVADERQGSGDGLGGAGLPTRKSLFLGSSAFEAERGLRSLNRPGFAGGRSV